MEQPSDNKRDAAPRRLVRDRPEDFVAGWFFPIPMPAFQAALDIERSERAKTTKVADGSKHRRTWYEWTQRAEPEWAFVEGDMFHAPAAEPGPWEEQLQTVRWTIQIKRVLDQMVTIMVWEHREARRSEHDMSMDGLATLLRTGRLPPSLDFAAAAP